MAGSSGGSGSFSKSRTGSSSAPYSAQALEQVPGLLTNVQQSAADIKNIGAKDIPSDADLWSLMSNRLVNTMRPGMAARGFLTSGNAQEMENRAVSELGTQFGANEFGQGLQRAQFQQAGAGMSMQGLLDALRSVLGQGQTSKSQGTSLGISASGGS